MKYAYSWARPLLAALFLFTSFGASAQQAWRPFRLGLIYSYAAVPATNSREYFTLRVDSAYVAANGDSVYAFNRRLREQVASSGRSGMARSKNNLFGASLRWQPGQPGYTLEALGQTDVQAAVSLTLFPRAAVGSSWTASSQPARTATLVSRSWQTVSPGVQDSVAVINIAGPSAQTVRLSRRYGLLEGPQWLGGAAGGQLEQAALPTNFEQSVYSPLRLFDMQVGDEFGYSVVDVIATVQCYDNKTLRRIIGRQLTNDSLIITFREQKRDEWYGYPGVCGGAASVTYQPIAVKRWALARRGNAWQSTGNSLPVGALRLLTGEYVYGPVPESGPIVSSPYLLAGLPIVTSTNGCATGLTVRYMPVYQQSGASNTYSPGVDYFAWGFFFNPGVGPSFERNYGMQYYRKTVNGVTTTCGTPQDFVTLLPTRAAQAAAVAMLVPNPATEAATLMLVQPARPGNTLRLTDALGRMVWSSPITDGQTTATIPLSGQPAGLYLLRLSGANGVSATWKLLHQ
ncbi:hypothetical protein GCM10022409_30310 [Hymenobacter glaciei]|uniref:Secretion system C-terminal sorting domain-containing protein n=1 Tax=Hymenobacter glaciei TaxID=877209 RepID=A0ABP7UFD8_9BACT